MVVTPHYAEYENTSYSGVCVSVLDTEVGYHTQRKNGVDFVFVDNPCYPRVGGPYADQQGNAYADNQYRFMLMCLAALEAPLNLPVNGSLYGEEVTFVANDWHAALVPVYLASKYRPHGVYTNARSILAIHNLRHQGVYPPTTFGMMGIAPDWYSSVEWQYPPHLRQGAYEEEGRAINTLKGGIVTADRIVTVSPGYAQEITTAEGGWGLEGLLASRAYALNGVLNGIDTDEWNPESDDRIYKKYSARTLMEGKAANKLAIQKELGLVERADVPLIGFIGRLDFQKGADLILGAAHWLLDQDVQLVCLGTGDQSLESGMRWLESTYPQKARAWVGYNETFAHKLTAAADIWLMPSRFEPCGLNQMYAMRYGAVPVVHATGGLRDTVQDFDPWKNSGTGWTFSPCSLEAFQNSISVALSTYHSHPESFTALQLAGMARECSWDRAASQYEEIFEWAAVDAPFCG